ncbi:MAG: enoyl-CoA hydratase/isomerase family protein [Ideonella sp.]|nr:enoyl-CoA hydratase/isomerase family protein [Ideonella sp.]
MPQFILLERQGRVGIIRLNRPEKLNAWNAQMREEIVQALLAYDADEGIGSIIMTGAGDRAFCAGQDLEEAHGFDADRAEAWMREWERYYGVLRSLAKPTVMALNGVTGGSAFQVAMLGDVRVAHPGVKVGQPEINQGIASVTGPWLMNSMLGMSRTTELVLTGRMMDADEAYRIGMFHHVVPASEVMAKAIEVATALAAKPPIAMRLTKQRLCEMTEPAFRDAIDAGIRIQRESYASGEPARMMEEFYRKRGSKVKLAPRETA